jgi:histidinol-phosphate aminotransferase
MPSPRFTRLVAELPATVPFVAAEAIERARGRPFRARIGANENVFGPSPKAVAELRRGAEEAWLYGDPEGHELKAAIAAFHRVTPAHVVLGEGIDALLGLTVRLFVEPGVEVVTSDGGYPTFDYHVAGFGGRCRRVAYVDDREDLPGLVDTVIERGAPLAYFANPDNPMSTWWDGAAVARELARLPEDALMILDEAYVDFAPEGTAPTIDPDDGRVIRFRTFSKAYGLAGLRVAYGIGAPVVVAAFDRIRNHFGLGRNVQRAALAALSDREWLAGVIAAVDRAKGRTAEIAAAAGLVTLPSASNFSTIDCGRDGAFARAVLDRLVARDLFVRKPWVAPMDRCIRVSAGTDADLELFAAALPAALAEAAEIVAASG